MAELTEMKMEPEKALLVEVDTGEYDAEASLAELYELVRSAGAVPFGAVTQKRPAPDTACFLSAVFPPLFHRFPKALSRPPSSIVEALPRLKRQTDLPVFPFPASLQSRGR